MADYVDPRITKPISNRLISEAIDAVNEEVEGGGGVALPIEISDVNGLEGELESKASTSDIPDVSDLATKTELTNGLAGKANTTHTHDQSQVSGLEAALNGKANATHVHAQGDITGLADALALKANVSQLPSANQLIPAGGSETTFLAGDNSWKVPVNTTYPALTEANANAGTATTASTISALVLKAAIETHRFPAPPASGVYHLVSTDGVLSWEEVVE